MIQVHTSAGAWGLVSMSPFCTKLETYLRLKSIPYKPRGAALTRAPKGKIPWVVFDDGRELGDSQLTLELLEREHPPALDGWLSDSQRATGRLVRRTLEEGVYFISMYQRWVYEPSWAVFAPAFAEAAQLPARLRAFVMPLIRRKVRASLEAQGTGRHRREEIWTMGIADIDAVAEQFVGPWFFGAKPSTVDATVFAFIDGIACFPVDTPLSLHVRQSRRWMDYCFFVKSTVFADRQQPSSTALAG